MATRNPKIDENDFDALDKLARSMTPEKMRPLSPAMRRRWEVAKRGRPRKSPGTKAVPTMITIDPKLLKRIDAGARSAGLSRSQFLANAARRELNLA
ncbi:MAG: ribbon-helix-helix protein, CopG family [Tepidisphaeraceae bacterium]|jgi:hypothetical protein